MNTNRAAMTATSSTSNTREVSKAPRGPPPRTIQRPATTAAHSAHIRITTPTGKANGPRFTLSISVRSDLQRRQNGGRRARRQEANPCKFLNTSLHRGTMTTPLPRIKDSPGTSP